MNVLADEASHCVREKPNPERPKHGVKLLRSESYLDANDSGAERGRRTASCTATDLSMS